MNTQIETQEEPMRKTIPAAVTAALLLAGALCLNAQPFRGPAERRPMHHPSPLTMAERLIERSEDLNLSARQVEKIKVEALNLEKRRTESENRMNLIELDLKELRLNESMDYERIKSLLVRAATERAEIHIAALKTRHAVEAILTPEQRNMLKKIRSRFEPRSRPPDRRRPDRRPAPARN